MTRNKSLPSDHVKRKNGFALIEILIAVAILSIVLLGVISGVTSSIYVIAGMKNYTQAMLIARSQMNDFIMKNMRGTDIKEKKVRKHRGFYWSRETKNFELPMFDMGPLAGTKETSIIVSWEERGKMRNYRVSYIYMSQ